MPSTEVPELDAYDTRILEELQRDARTSMAELGRKVHLSQPAVTERVRKLEIAGFIKGYRAVVDYQRLGYGIRALVRAGRVEYGRMLQLNEQTPEVERDWSKPSLAALAGASDQPRARGRARVRPGGQRRKDAQAAWAGNGIRAGLTCTETRKKSEQQTCLGRNIGYKGPDIRRSRRPLCLAPIRTAADPQ